VPSTPFAWSHQKTQVDYDGRALTVNGKRLPIEDIERLARSLTISRAQGSWMRLEASVHLLCAGKVTTVRLRGDGRDEQWGPWRPDWDLLDQLVREEIGMNLLLRTIDRVQDGQLTEIGSGRSKGRGRYTVTSESLQSRGWRAKTFPWREIVDISDDLDITTVDAEGKQQTRALGLSSIEWDAWQVRTLWRHFGGQ
jgi:hypothetical protein